MARTFTWIPPDGSTPIVLNDRAAGYRLMQNGTAGLHAPPYRFTTAQYAGVDGESLQALTAGARPISLSVRIEAPDEATFRARWRALARAMRPKAGDGRLEVRDEVAAARTLTCRYESGLEGDGSDMFDGTQGGALVKLVAFRPWWEGPETTLDFGLAAPTAFFPITPVVLSASTIQGQQTVDLSATDSVTYPVWTITGPGNGLVLTNLTTGRTIVINTSIADGQTLVIDTRPGRQSVRRGDGTNQMGTLASDPALWPLIDGVNAVSVQLGSAVQGASRIRGVFTPRYAGI